jgi:hypothetical protein
VASGREDNRIGEVDGPITGVQVERDRAEAGAVSHQQPRDVLILLDLDTELSSLARDRPQDGSPGEVAGVARPPPAVGAEVALVEGKSVQRCLLDLLSRESKDELADFQAWVDRLARSE